MSLTQPALTLVGRQSGVILEQLLGRPFLDFGCRHLIMELALAVTSDVGLCMGLATLQKLSFSNGLFKDSGYPLTNKDTTMSSPTDSPHLTSSMPEMKSLYSVYSSCRIDDLVTTTANY